MRPSRSGEGICFLLIGSATPQAKRRKYKSPASGRDLIKQERIVSALVWSRRCSTQRAFQSKHGTKRVLRSWLLDLARIPVRVVLGREILAKENQTKAVAKAAAKVAKAVVRGGKSS